MKAGFDQIDERFDRMYRLMVTVSATMVCALIAACAGLVATQL
jgi:hypothetical protein